MDQANTDFIGLIEPTDLYNILNQSFNYASVSDPNYLLLIDARDTHEYNESHVVTAKKAPRDAEVEYQVPYDSEIECKRHVVVYDGTTSSLDDTDSKAYRCAKVLADCGSRNPVLILNGGYERFSASYPFLRTQKIIWLPQELDALRTYPAEIIPGVLYMGDCRQGNAPYIQKDLKIKAHVNCCGKADEIFPEEGEQLLNIPVTDDTGNDIKCHLAKACLFIDEHKKNNEPVLVFSTLGISRAALVCIAYLTHSKAEPIQASYDFIRKCSAVACPNTGFLEQLQQWHSTLPLVE